jgi:hypothetical protein
MAQPTRDIPQSPHQATVYYIPRPLEADISTTNHHSYQPAYPRYTLSADTHKSVLIEANIYHKTVPSYSGQVENRIKLTEPSSHSTSRRCKG